MITSPLETFVAHLGCGKTSVATVPKGKVVTQSVLWFPPRNTITLSAMLVNEPTCSFVPSPQSLTCKC